LKLDTNITANIIDFIELPLGDSEESVVKCDQSLASSGTAMSDCHGIALERVPEFFLTPGQELRRLNIHSFRVGVF
jgi:hypothetical protein